MGLGTAGVTRARAIAPLSGESWLLRGKDGRLSAYATTDGGLLRWTETRAGGPDWQGPDFFEAPAAEGLTAAQGPDGFVHVVGRGTAKDGSPDYVHATQYQSGRPFGSWHSLGSFRYPDPAQTAKLGRPAVAVGAQGAVHVFLRNAFGGVLMRCQAASGKWGGWQDLIGSRAEEALVPTRLSSGLLELLAVKKDGTVLRWTQEKPGAAFSPVTVIPFTVTAGTVTALETSEDGLTYYGTAPGQVAAQMSADGTAPGQVPADGTVPAQAPSDGAVPHRQEVTAFRLGLGPDPASAPSAVPLGGTPATEPGVRPAALRATMDGHDCTVLAHRTTGGRPALAASRTLAEHEGVWWAETGPECVGAPALALDAADRVVMAVIGAEGALHVARQRTDEEGLALAAWQRV
ncbi:hypothetical protein ACIQM4_01310 [Streptomyces sp. NPDC091272]|uniref:hypothetical protein n=1 Tax=Streptomyces sp. NPDC091272 TaxID=3365981 RepID=UPI00382F1708